MSKRLPCSMVRRVRCCNLPATLVMLVRYISEPVRRVLVRTVPIISRLRASMAPATSLSCRHFGNRNCLRRSALRCRQKVCRRLANTSSVIFADIRMVVWLMIRRLPARTEIFGLSVLKVIYMVCSTTVSGSLRSIPIILNVVFLALLSTTCGAGANASGIITPLCRDAGNDS